MTPARRAPAPRKALAAGTYRLQPGGTAGHLQLVSRAGGVTKGLVAPVQVTPGSQPLRLDDSAGIGFAGDHWHGSFRVIESGSSLLLRRRGRHGEVPARRRPERDAGLVAAARAEGAGGRRPLLRVRHPQPVRRLRRLRRHPQPGVRPDRARGGGVDGRRRPTPPIRSSGTSSTVATTFFSSSSGGRTSSEQAAWGTTSGEPYLVPVIDRYDSAGGANPNHTWAPQTYTPAGLAHGARPLRGRSGRSR